jgi:hypothetical protein
MNTYISRRLAVIFAFIVLAVALVAFYWPWLTETASFYIFDFTYGWHSNIEHVADQLRSGRFALWNPYIMCGISQLAMTAPSVFYPPDCLLALFSFNRGMALLFVLNQCLAAIGAFLLISACGLSALPALIGAAVYAVSGYFFSAQVAYSYQATATWVPWCVWALLKVDPAQAGLRPPLPSSGATKVGPPVQSQRKQMYLFTALSAIFIALMITAAFFEMSGPVLQALILGSITLALLARSGRPIKVLLLRASAIVAGILLSMPVILPLVQWAPLSPRAGGLPAGEIMRWSATWYDLAMLILPQPLGDLYNSSNPFELLPSIHATPLLASVFVGPVIFTLAIRGLAGLKRPWQTLVIISTLGIIAAALGNNTPFGPVLLQHLHMPFRYPVKLLYFVMIILCGLAALGTRSLIQRSHRGGNRAAAYAWVFVALAGVWLAVPSGAAEFASLIGGNESLAQVAASEISKSIFTTTAAGVIALGLMTASDFGKINSRFCAVILLLATMSIYFAHAYLFAWHPGPADFFQRPVALAESIRRLGASYPGAPIRFAAMYQDPARIMDASELAQWTVNNYQHVRQMLVSPNQQQFGIGNIVARSPGELEPLYRSMMFARARFEPEQNAAPFEHYCQMTGTPIAVTQVQKVSFNHVLSAVGLLNPLRFHLEEQNARENYRVYTLVHPFPRAYFARKVAWGKPHEQVVRTIAEDYHFPLDKITILEHNYESEIGEKFEAGSEQAAASQVQFVQEEPDRVQLKVKTPVKNYLVLLDQNYPGWQAFIDSASTPIWTANASFRAVLVPAGEHIVEFRFMPAVLPISLALAGIGVAYALLLLWLALKR